MKNIFIILLLSVLAYQCSPGVLKGKDLTKDDIEYIKSLGILEENEEIIKFSSSFRKKISGNFYTDRRIASYWQYDKSPKDNYIKSAKYTDIKSVELKHGDGFEHAPSIIVNLKNGNSFEVYFDCENDQFDKIFQEVKNLIK